MEVLEAETNHVERLHGLEVWNRTKTLSVMTKRDWSSIHGKVKEAESMKKIWQWCGFQDGTEQRGEQLLLLSLAF